MVNNVAGIYFTPIAEDFGVGIGATSLTLTISNYMFAISGILVPRLLKTVSFRKILFIGTLGVVLGTAGLSVAASLPVLYLFNILRGYSCGLISQVLVISGICLLLFVPQPTISLVAAALLGFSFSLPTVGIVLMIRGLFGTENYGSVYPKISMAITITSASGYFIIGLLYDLSGSYRLNLWIMLGLLVLMTLMVFQAYRSGIK